jgi:ribosome biogenesis GTPase
MPCIDPVSPVERQPPWHHRRRLRPALRDRTGRRPLATGYPRGKKSPFAVGDEVELSPDGQITGHATRRSLLYRSDAYRQKLIAANATQLLLVVATDPSFSDMLLSPRAGRRRAPGPDHHHRAQQVRPHRRAARRQKAAGALHRARLPRRRTLGQARSLAPAALLAGESSVLVGQSGMGKSTLTNALVPGAAAPTRELSTALDSGKHTTTYARLYKLPDDTCPGGTLIDSPGLQEFGLKHLTPQEIEFGFAEFRPFLGQCRFRDCQHDAEPGCAIKQALAEGMIHPRRLDHFHQFISEQ